MGRRYSFPQGHWNWPLKLSHFHAVRHGSLIFTGGQVDLDAAGNVQNPGDMEPQCRNAMAYLRTLLRDLEADFCDLVRLVVYYIGDAEDEKRLLALLADIIGKDVGPAINLINMPALCYPHMRIEIEGVAMASDKQNRLDRHNYTLDDMPVLHDAFSHVVRCGELVFTSDMSARSADGSVFAAGDIVAQTQKMMAQLERALAAAGASMSDVAKINTFYCGDGTAQDWAVSAGTRASYFERPGPAVTGIPLPSFPHAGMLTQISATAFVAPNEAEHSQSRGFAWPDRPIDGRGRSP